MEAPLPTPDASQTATARLRAAEEGPASIQFPHGAYRANLYVYGQSGRIEWYALSPQHFERGQTLNFGRGAHYDIGLDDSSVSGLHAALTFEAGQLHLVDLKSTNGSFVNGERIQRQALQHGDVLRLGGTDLRFLYSYRSPPIHLNLSFSAGPHEGSQVRLEGASASLGQRGCVVRLSGEGVGEQHARIDAYGPELIFVVNLQPHRNTLLNGQPVLGVAAARAGDLLRIGPHQMYLEVLPADTPIAQKVERTPASARIETLAQVSTEFSPGEGEDSLENTVFDGRNHSDLLVQLDAKAVEMELAASLQQQTLVSSLIKLGEPIEEPRHIMAPTQELDRSILHTMGTDTAWPPAAPPLQHATTAQVAVVSAAPKRRRRPALWIAAAALLALTAALAVGLTQKVPQSLELRGRLGAAPAKPLLAPISGTISQLMVRTGELVHPQTAVATISDDQSVQALQRIDAQIAALTPDLQPSHRVRPVEVPIALRRQILKAENALDRAQVERRTMLDAFNRREIGLEPLEAARLAEQRAAEQLAGLNAQLKNAQGKVIEETVPPPAEELDYLEALRARKAQLNARTEVTVHAAEAGLMRPISKRAAPETGETVRAGQPLWEIVPLDTLDFNVEVDEQTLKVLEAAGSLRAQLKKGEEPTQIELKPSPATPLEGGYFLLRYTVENPDRSLRPGMPVHAQLSLGERPLLQQWLSPQTYRVRAPTAP